MKSTTVKLHGNKEYDIIIARDQTKIRVYSDMENVKQS